MNKRIITGILLAGLCTGISPLQASDAELCLDCHEPAEDWEGMSAEEVLEFAKDAGIKRHADNQELSDEQLQAIVAELLQQK